MSINRVILHIGAGKCGSSALQAYLSRSGELKDAANKEAVYGVLLPDGRIITGKEVAERALSSVYQYASSTTMGDFAPSYTGSSSTESLEKLTADTLILSCEGWINDPELATELLAWLDKCTVEVVAYVRPPVPWLNSAWWQWGAWSDAEFNHWIDSCESMTYWATYIKRWEKVPFVNKIHVRLLPKDIVSDFLNFAGLSETSVNGPQLETLSNVSLPGSVLRVYQKHRQLRPSPHESKLDFSLSRRLKDIKQSPDWVISAEKIENIIQNTKPHNEELKRYFDSTQLSSFCSDPRWWSVDAFQSYTDVSSQRSITEEETQEIVVQSLFSLHDAELEIIELKNKLRKMSA